MDTPIFICGHCGYITKRDERRCHICNSPDWLMAFEQRAAEQIAQRVHERAGERMALRAEINRTLRGNRP